MGLEQKVAMYSAKDASSFYERSKQRVKDFLYQPTIPHRLAQWYGFYRLSGVKPQFVQDKPLEELATMTDADKVISIVGNAAGAVRWALGDLPLYLLDTGVYVAHAGIRGVLTGMVLIGGGVKIGVDSAYNGVARGANTLLEFLSADTKLPVISSGNEAIQEMIIETASRAYHYLGEFQHLPWHNSREVVDHSDAAWASSNQLFEYTANILERYQLHPSALLIGGVILAGTQVWRRHYLKNLALPGGDDE